MAEIGSMELRPKRGGSLPTRVVAVVSDSAARIEHAFAPGFDEPESTIKLLRCNISSVPTNDDTPYASDSAAAGEVAGAGAAVLVGDYAAASDADILTTESTLAQCASSSPLLSTTSASATSPLGADLLTMMDHAPVQLTPTLVDAADLAATAVEEYASPVTTPSALALGESSPTTPSTDTSNGAGAGAGAGAGVGVSDAVRFQPPSTTVTQPSTEMPMSQSQATFGSTMPAPAAQQQQSNIDMEPPDDQAPSTVSSAFAYLMSLMDKLDEAAVQIKLEGLGDSPPLQCDAKQQVLDPDRTFPPNLVRLYSGVMI